MHRWAVRRSHLSSSEARETLVFTPVRGSVWEPRLRWIGAAGRVQRTVRLGRNVMMRLLALCGAVLIAATVGASAQSPVERGGYRQRHRGCSNCHTRAGQVAPPICNWTSGCPAVRPFRLRNTRSRVQIDARCRDRPRQLDGRADQDGDHHWKAARRRATRAEHAVGGLRLPHGARPGCDRRVSAFDSAVKNAVRTPEYKAAFTISPFPTSSRWPTRT